MNNEWPFQDVNAMNAYYGDPDTNRDGHPNQIWEAENIMRVIPPYRMFLSWNPSQALKTISIHKKCAASLARILARIAAEIPPDDIEKYHLNRFGGAYNFRLMRGLNALSIHSWGAAIDLAPELNPMGVGYGNKPNMMPLSAVQIFKDEGWTWLGLCHRPDAMHFQAANLH